MAGIVSMVSREARAFQPAAETRDGEHTLRLLTLKSDQGPIPCMGSFRGEASGFAFERVLIDFMAAQTRVAVYTKSLARARDRSSVSPKVVVEEVRIDSC